ncbi:MAG: hypothetical protein WAT79_14055 [Saprospiraceae bacterium]
MKYLRLCKIILLSMILGCIIVKSDVHAQILTDNYQVTFGAMINLNHNTSGQAFRNNFSSIKAFVGFNGSHTLSMHKTSRVNQGLFNYSLSFTIYNRSLGNSLNILYQDNQIDFTTSITLGLLNRPNPNFVKNMQTINNTPFYNLRHFGKHGAFITSNFILNNHGRHQTVGALSLTTDQVSVNYYNDGGPIIGKGFEFNYKKILSYLLLPLHLISGLGDGFDRWWTGGGGVYVHTKQGFNRVEVTFDQFTGYHKLAYELSGILGSDVQDYDLFQEKAISDTLENKTPLNFKTGKSNAINYNSSTYGIKYFFENDLSVNFGVIGSLRNHKNERFFALQDIIHLNRRDPIHPNNDINRIYYGLSYYKPFTIK